MSQFDTRPAESPGRPFALDRRLSVGVPAYYYPGPMWERTLAAGPLVRYIVVNPGDGPGVGIDASYTAAVRNARAAGITLLGYVPTGWGRRALGDVVRDVRTHAEFYGITNIFLDEVSTSAAFLRHYARIADEIRGAARESLLALNPGVTPDEDYLGIADVLMQYEGPWNAYSGWSPPEWQHRYDPERFWHVVYATPARMMRSALRSAVDRGVGIAYVTDARANPWESLPSYWHEELAAISALGPRRAPGASTT